MPRDEFIAWLNRLIVDGAIEQDEALAILAKYDRGAIDGSVLPPGALVTNEVGGAEEAAIILFLLALLGERQPGDLTEVQHLATANEAHDRFATYAVEAAVNEGSIDDWQRGMMEGLIGLSGALFLLGAAALTPALRRELLPILQTEAAYLSRFGDQRLLAQVRGNPLSAVQVAARAASYGALARAASFALRERRTNQGAGWVQQYIATDDQGTCSPCLDAEGYYLPGEGPMPGQVCLGRGRCRCSRVTIYAPEIYERLTI